MTSVRFWGLRFIPVVFILSQFLVAGVREFVFQQLLTLYVDKELVDYNTSIRRINRTDYALSVDFWVFKDGMAEDAAVDIQLYSLHNNEYREEPVHIKRTICAIFDMEYNFIKASLMKAGNLPTACPVSKGYYHLKDYVLVTSTVPDSPWRDMKLHIDFLYKDKPFLTVSVTFQFNPDAKLINQFL